MIELLVGLSLWVVVAMTLMRVFQGGLRLWKKNEEAAPLKQEARVILAGMAREYRNSIDVPGEPASLGKNEISWVTAIHGPIRKVSYRLQAPSMRLVRSEQKLTWEGRQPEIDTPMTSGPASLSWEYAFAGPQGGILWKERWTPANPQARPCGLRVKLTLFDKHSDPETYQRTIFIPTSEALPWAS